MKPATPLTLEQLRDFAPWYALGLLDGDERAAFERGRQHPEYAATLERDLASHGAAAEAIATAQPVAPPSALKARMMERISAEKRASVIGPEAERVHEPVVVATETPRKLITDDVRDVAMARHAGTATVAPQNVAPQDVAPEDVAPEDVAPEDVAPRKAEAVRQSPTSRATRVVTPPMPSAVIERSARRTARTAWWTAGVLGAALAASIVVAVDLRQQTGELRDLSTRNTARSTRAEALLAEREATLNTLLEGRGNVVLVNLNPAKPSGPGMQVFWNVREGKAVVNAYGLMPVASNRAYMLWMIRDGKPVPLKLFTPGDDGRAIVASVELPTTTSGITLLAVTEESSAGAVAPTMTPFLVGEVPTRSAAQ